MNEELRYYESVKNWDFSQIKYEVDRKIQWEFYDQIKKRINEKSLCLDLGTGGGEKVLNYYPKVGMVIATDFSAEMIKTANENLKQYENKNVKFVQMDNLNMTFPKELFDLVSARHTVINAKQIYDVLKPNGVLVIEGVDKNDCLDLKELLGRGQAYKDKVAISQKDYEDIKAAGFSKIERVEIIEEEYYKTKEDLMALLLKTPILDDFSEIAGNVEFEHNEYVEEDLFEKYVEKFTTERGILLKRVLYGIVAIK